MYYVAQWLILIVATMVKIIPFWIFPDENCHSGYGCRLHKKSKIDEKPTGKSVLNEEFMFRKQYKSHQYYIKPLKEASISTSSATNQGVGIYLRLTMFYSILSFIQLDGKHFSLTV
eukprot:snap_masked-scaffold_12-processed-gene-10.32-mRNA-1 protein AED:1.00 eAED:1.00 QI:0/0/0/0/1/1/2/0/115